MDRLTDTESRVVGGGGRGGGGVEGDRRAVTEQSQMLAGAGSAVSVLTGAPPGARRTRGISG